MFKPITSDLYHSIFFTKIILQSNSFGEKRTNANRGSERFKRFSQMFIEEAKSVAKKRKIFFNDEKYLKKMYFYVI